MVYLKFVTNKLLPVLLSCLKILCGLISLAKHMLLPLFLPFHLPLPPLLVSSCGAMKDLLVSTGFAWVLADMIEDVPMASLDTNELLQLKPSRIC